MKNHVDLELSDDIPALVDQAQGYCDKGLWAFARQTLEKLFALGHDLAKTATHLGDVCGAEGDAAEAIRWHRIALGIDPRRYQSQEHLIFLLDAQEGTTEDEATAERHNWWDRFGAVAYARRQPHTNWAHPEKRLRVGHVGGDWNFHSAAIAFVNVVSNYSDAIQPVFYSTLEPFRYDHRTKLWKERYGPAFVDVSGMSASLLANTIRADEIDILVDLAGFTGNNRLLTFAECPAPIRIQAFGYVLGTQSPALTHVFADPIVASPAIRARLTEQVVDLPAVLSYHPRPDLPSDPSPLPCLTQPPLFSVFQRAMKVTPAACAVWKTILERVPGAQILFKGGDYSPLRREVIADAFGELRGRILFDFQNGHHDHMLQYQSIDLALDTWPQTGGVSTLEAMWMNVPTVTLIGERMIQRASASFLTAVGHPEFIAETPEQYIDIAVSFVTTRRDELAQVRRTLRAQMQASPIMTGYVEAVEKQYRSLWRTWCAKQKEQAA